jgi:hypothetical protein
MSVLRAADSEESAQQQSDQTNVRAKQRANRARCLRRVKNGPDGPETPLSVYRYERTSSDWPSWSVRCHKAGSCSAANRIAIRPRRPRVRLACWGLLRLSASATAITRYDLMQDVAAMRPQRDRIPPESCWPPALGCANRCGDDARWQQLCAPAGRKSTHRFRRRPMCA